MILRNDGSGTQGGGTYDFLGPEGSSLGYITKAAHAGDNIELYGVGLGPTDPAIASGIVLAPGYFGKATSMITVLINNISVTPSFAGITEAGLFQINVTIPPGLGAGNVPIVITAGGAQTQNSVFIPIE